MWATSSAKKITDTYHIGRSHTERVLRQFGTFIQLRSLRQRLIVWTTGLVVVLFAVLSIATYFFQEHSLQDNASQTLAREVLVVRADVQQQVFWYPPLWPADIRLIGINAISDPGLTVEVKGVAGTLRYTTDSDPNDAPLPIKRSEDLQAMSSGNTLYYTRTVQGDRTLIAVTPLTTNENQLIGVVHVARSLSEVDNALGNLQSLLIVTNVVALGLAIFGGWFLTRRALAPLTEIAGVANAITQSLTKPNGRTPEALRMRVPPVNETGELGNLVEDVNHMLAALERYDERQRHFIADASHELRTPLTTIRGNLDLVRRSPDLSPEVRAQAIQDAADESSRMAILINDLLMLARAESSGATRKYFAPVELDVILVDVFRLAHARIQAQELHHLAVQLVGLEPAQVAGDAMQLRQVFLIFVDNALKYAPTGTLTLGMSTTASRVNITFADSGEGIAPKDLPHIFDRFYRADTGRDREGSGLGLAIARILVEQHGGAITVESAPGRGTTFTIALPRLSNQPASDGLPDEHADH